jgi:hypothetical protein
MAALAHVGLEHGPSIAALCHDFDPETDGCSDRRVALAIFSPGMIRVHSVMIKLIMGMSLGLTLARPCSARGAVS